MKDQQMTKKKIHDLEQQETLACVDAMDENGVFHLFRKAAELFSSCMNDYLYVYDITNDTYYITERRSCEIFNSCHRILYCVCKQL